MKVLSTYDYGFKKYLSDSKNGYIKVEAKKDAKLFLNEDEAINVKMTLLNKEDFFIETIKD